MLLGFGDSYTAGGGKRSYPDVAADLLFYDVHNYAVGGSTTSMILPQLVEARKNLLSATQIVFTIGGNDLAGIQTLVNIAQVNITEFQQKCASFQPTLVSTYKLIQSVVRPETKIYALPYVDIISVGNKIPYEAECHKVYQAMNDAVRNASAQVNIGFIEPVISAFLGHEIYSADPYADGYDNPGNLYHPNQKGYTKIGEVVAAYIKSH